jgi:hypothetical protein
MKRKVAVAGRLLSQTKRFSGGWQEVQTGSVQVKKQAIDRSAAIHEQLMKPLLALF